MQKVKIVYDPNITLRQVTRIYTILAMDHFGGRKEKVARALGITTKTLYNWLQEFGLFTPHSEWVAGRASQEVANTFVDESTYNDWRARAARCS